MSKMSSSPSARLWFCFPFPVSCKSVLPILRIIVGQQGCWKLCLTLPHPQSILAFERKSGDNMAMLILCIGISAVIWIVNGKMIIQAVKERITCEIFGHTGLGVYFTLLVLELTLGRLGLWTQANILWLRIIGFALYVPSAFLIVASTIQLTHKGKSKTVSQSLAPHGTAGVVQSGIYGVVRHPMWLGMAIWSVALILAFQTILSIILGVIGVFCFRMAAVKEDRFNIREFGEAYEEYAREVPAWNFLKRVRKS